MPVWRNWQTHRTQNPAVAIPYRFDPDHRHKIIQPCIRFYDTWFFLWFFGSLSIVGGEKSKRKKIQKARQAEGRN